ncbi:Alkylphosphonate utilization operon protein PhnA [Fulvivirga imtechensis AK7]|uniref:Alkylphosphonate utilization operon protein PhnA n=1 Tax=Fulvivirga imtechensis AK7 TaxID=1237149 RepID=L8JMN4_9BACT|nr:alkylphosphonate utilization protein [Fulvivirga imtechensis]ELR69503.1 Alkylphosphonate utilization operon protein PhnA [Fulvivirga imtechensis AK7]
MNIEKELYDRSGAKCELCEVTENLTIYEVAPAKDGGADQHILVCKTCLEQIEDPDAVDANHWRCLNDSMWSQVPAVQVVAWRMLNRLRGEGWPVELLDMLYLDEETLAWAKATGEGTNQDEALRHIDSNGALLQAGDTVVLIKDLNVKGANFTAKRGTAVRGISLVVDNPEQIEGKVNGQQIVILTKFVKKSS